MNKSILSILLLFIVFPISAQIPLGTWRDHLPYREATNIVQLKDKIFCTTPYAVFYYDLQDNSVENISITNGLSDIGTSALNYFPEKDLLVLAYSNGNIDLIRGTKVTNIRDIKQKQIQGDKNIYQIEFSGDKIYLACGFGIVKINPDKDEVEDTYYIGDNASEIPVFGIAFDSRYIYAATDNTIYFAEKDNPYLFDYNNWDKLSGLPVTDGKYSDLIFFDGRLFVNFLSNTDGRSYVYMRDIGGSWQLFYSSDNFIRRIKVAGEELFVLEENNLSSYNKSLIQEKNITDYGFGKAQPMDVIYSDDGALRIADKIYALVSFIDNTFSQIEKNGPFTNHVADIDARANLVCAAGGGQTSFLHNLYNHPEAYTFKDENWRSDILWNTDVRDFVSVLIDPFNTDRVFYGSWGGGVFEFQNNEVVNIFNEQNSSLQAVIPGQLSTYIGSMAIDQEQNLWVTNPWAQQVISVKTQNGDWYSLNYPEVNSKPVNKIIVTQNGTKWVQLERGGGLFAFNDNYTPGDVSDDEHRLFYAYDENGEFITKDIYSIAEDKDGAIWVGTDQGVLTYFNPQNVFSGDYFYADRIKLVDAELDSLVQYLLGSETVTAIAIDGANRKWFGTRNSGVYLMSEDCRTEIFHFHTDNSPLFSNTILDIAINEKTGEVFIGTPLGIVSFKGTATEGNKTYTDAYVYPNPVRETYEGNITITGLAPNVNVKITDVAGRLVYETRAFGGQAIWNGKTFSGERVKTGVYLIFCTDDAGEYKKVLKLLFIN